MADGHLNKCKECTKTDATRHRNANLDKIRKYDRGRGNRQPPEYHLKYRAEKPNAYKAKSMVNNAIRDGKLFREPCEVCCSEENAHAHHDDYLKPLNVRWLCAVCHKQWHAVNGEGLNARSPIK
ncbi:MAG: hypothetical protein GY941_04985 [Planctomycetes bacterium]|nr:hypothetical protein [Planctomycetota bacterium]